MKRLAVAASIVSIISISTIVLLAPCMSASAAFAASGAPEPAAAESRDDLPVVFLGDVSGPVGFWNAPRLVGIQDAIDYLNENTGGIAGRQIRLTWIDHKSDVALAERGYRELLGKKALIWHTCGTGEQQLLKPLYEKDASQVIFTCSTSPGVIYPVGHVFGTAPYYPEQFGAFMDWLVETWDEKAAGRMPRVAILTYNSGYGRACITDESLEYARSKRIEIVGVTYIPFVTTDPLTPLLKAKEAGADWVFGQWLWQTVPPYLIANKEHNLGLKFCVTSFGVDQVMVEKGGDAAEGLTGVTSWYLPDESTPGVNMVNEALRRKSRRPEDRGTSYYLGWMNMWQTKMAIEQTLERVKDWSKVTPNEIVATLEQWNDMDVNGLGRLHYSPRARGADMIRIVQVKAGKWRAATDWRKCPVLVPPTWLQTPAAASREPNVCCFR